MQDFVGAAEASVSDGQEKAWWEEDLNRSDLVGRRSQATGGSRMVRVEQTEFWSDVDEQSRTAETSAFTRRNDSVYVDETASLTDWFLDDDEEVIVDETLDALLEEPVVTRPVVEPEPAQTPPVPERAQATMARSVYADKSAPKFNMARFLTLTGSLDAVEEDGRFLALPSDSFRPRVMLDAVRRISKDFLKDLRSPPRSYSISRHQRPSGWLKL